MPETEFIIKFKSSDIYKNKNVINILNEIAGDLYFKNAEPLFLDESVNNLSLIYVVELFDVLYPTDLLSNLNNHNEIEYAHVSPIRKFI